MAATGVERTFFPSGPIAVDHPHGVDQGRRSGHGLPVGLTGWNLPAVDAPGTGRSHQQYLGTREGEPLRQMRVPQILADDQPRRRLHPCHQVDAAAGTHEPPLLEDSVGRQVELAMDMIDPAAVKHQAAVEEHAAIALLDQSDDDAHLAGGLPQLPHGSGVLESRRYPTGEVEEPVAGQGQLREEQQLDTGGTRTLHPLEMLVEIGFDVAESRVDLGETDGQLGGHGSGERCSVWGRQGVGGELC